MKEIRCNQTLTELPTHFPKKLNQALCKICYTENMTTLHKVTTVDTTNFQPEEIIHIDFDF